jgi:flagellar motor protein MotB
MADFALAMMALFLVLWIISNSTEAQRQAISGYFADPQAFIEGRRAPSAAAIDLGGSPSVLANIGQSGNSDAMINRQPAPDRGDDNDQQQQQQQQQQQPLSSPYREREHLTKLKVSGVDIHSLGRFNPAPDADPHTRQLDEVLTLEDLNKGVYKKTDHQK